MVKLNVIYTRTGDKGETGLGDGSRRIKSDARIAHFEAPKSVDFVDSIPGNITGKVLRRELREPYWKGRDRRVN